MSIASRLRNYLDKSNVPYMHCTHRLAFTAQEVAAAQHVPGKDMAKTVILKADDRYIMCVLPAVRQIDLKALEGELPYAHIQLATEKEFAWLFEDCEVGAMAPFGNLYDLPVFVDESLALDEDIVFNAGTHVDTIRMKYRDFERLVQPAIIHAAKATA